MSKLVKGIQKEKSDNRDCDDSIKLPSKLHVSVGTALTESNLLERVREFRRSSLNVADTNGNLSVLELSNRAQSMLKLKQASELFYILLSPISVAHIKILQEFKLEQTLSRYYWHTLFLANNCPEQGKFELDSLCSNLYRAKNSLSGSGTVLANPTLDEIAESDERADSQSKTPDEINSHATIKKAYEESSQKTADELLYKTLDESLDQPAVVTPEEALKEPLKETPNVILGEALEQLLQETPEVLVRESLEDALDATSVESREESLEHAQNENSLDSLQGSLAESLDETLVDSLERSLEQPSDQTADESLEEALEQLLDETAGESLEKELEELEESLQTTTKVPLEEELERSMAKSSETSLQKELELSFAELLGNMPEETVEIAPDGLSEITPELFTDAVHKGSLTIAPDYILDVTDEDLSEVVLDGSSELAPVTSSGVVPASVSVDAPDSTADSAHDSASEIVPDSTAKFAHDSASEIVPDSTAEFAHDSASEIVPDRTAESVHDNASEIVPDSTADSAHDNASEIVPDRTAESAHDSASEIVPDSTVSDAPVSSVFNAGINSHDLNTTLPTEMETNEAYRLSNKTEKVADSIQARGGAISGLTTGVSAVLLIVLAAAAFTPGILHTFQTKVPVGTTPYRLIMVFLLFTLTTSFFLLISKFITAGVNTGKPNTDVNIARGFFNRLLDIGASPRRVLAGAVGPILLGLGQGISISAGYGAFGYSVFLDGLNKTFLIPFWISHIVVTVGCYFLAWHWGRVPLGLGTLAALLLIGPAISFGASIVPEGLASGGNVAVFAVGLFLFALGIALAASAALGPDGFSSLSLAAERIHHWAFPSAALLWDITAVGAGMILGGSVGIATAIGLLAVPFLLHLLIPPLRRVLH